MLNDVLETPDVPAFAPSDATSGFWNLVSARGPFAWRAAKYASMALAGVVLTLPRMHEHWFRYALIAYPTFAIVMLEMLRRTTGWLARAHDHAEELLAKPESRASLRAAWTTVRKRRVGCAVGIGLALAGASLVFNQNQAWSRYTDALAVLHLGSLAGELAFQIMLVPWLFLQLQPHALRVNPLDPANTVALRKLAGLTVNVGLAAATALGLINGTFAVAAWWYPHLLAGVVGISVVAWVTSIAVAIYPQLILFGIVQRAKTATLRVLERKLIDLSDAILCCDKAPESAESLLKLQSHVLTAGGFPIRAGALLGIASTLLLNTLPSVIGALLGE